jgi:hypothetical protein
VLQPIVSRVRGAFPRGCYAAAMHGVAGWSFWHGSLCDTTRKEAKGSHKQIDPVFDGSSLPL